MKNKMSNARVFITGANGGIGKEVVKLLIDKKVKSITLACRTKDKAEKVRTELQNNHTVLEAFGGFDMNNKIAIKGAVEQMNGNDPFDIVFLQSGGMIVGENFQFIESDGQKIERTIYQNTIGAYITLKFLLENNLVAKNARVVFPGGEGARGVKGFIKKPDFTSVKKMISYINSGSEIYKDFDALGVSKFMSGLLVQKLAEIDNEKEYVWFSPGLTAGTSGLQNVPNPKRFFMEKLVFPFMMLIGLAQSPKQAAKKYVECLEGSHGESGDLIGAPDGKALGKLVDQKPMNSGLTNHQFIETFWDIAVKVGGEWPGLRQRVKVG